jgi:hypothetical protein
MKTCVEVPTTGLSGYVPTSSQSHSHVTTDGQSVRSGVEPDLGLVTTFYSSP